MTARPLDPLTTAALTRMADFEMGPLRVSPARRSIDGPNAVRRLQPQIMLVFLCLAKAGGQVVTRRELFDRCWAGVPVGEDSLNRALTRIRQTLYDVAGETLAIETIPGTGYRLITPAGTFRRDELAEAVQAAIDCLRAGVPQSDDIEIGRLMHAIERHAGAAAEIGILALILRKASEYATAENCANYVRQCEIAVRNATNLDPKEPNARIALAGLLPLFGNWARNRGALAAVLEEFPENQAALHDMAILEMATGRPSAAMPIIDHLIERDPFAAAYHYKRMYHLWTLGDFHRADQEAGRALTLWPRHPAIWMARFWILMFTSRAEVALRLACDQDNHPAIPESAVEFLRKTAQLIAEGAGSPARARHADLAAEIASHGPAYAVASLQTLCVLDARDQAFAVARGYYLSEGGKSAPLRWNAADPSITDQHRRVTQPLFTPAWARFRADPRFEQLCVDIGLTAYWEHFGIIPDFAVGHARLQSASGSLRDQTTTVTALRRKG